MSEAASAACSPGRYRSEAAASGVIDVAVGDSSTTRKPRFSTASRTRR